MVGNRIGDKALVDQCMNFEVQVSSPEVVAEAVRQLCIQHFFHEPKFRVDMSKYRALVEEHAPRLKNPEEVRKLYGYVDEERKLSEVYEAVKKRLCTPLYQAALHPETPPPTFEDLKGAVDEEIAEAHRRAEKHIAGRLAKACDESPQSPSQEDSLGKVLTLIPPERGRGE